MTAINPRTMHVGRSWSGTRLEDACSCGKAPCGLVDMALIDNACEQHGIPAMKTMRQIHAPEDCPARDTLTPLDQAVVHAAERMRDSA